jgi:hypothetical protein
MKFDIGNVKDYGGEDLIFLTGAPGSRFSGAFRVMSNHPSVNKSEWKDEYVWDKLVHDVHGNRKFIGVHRGVYWGPGNTHGQKFDNMLTLTKSEILSEFMEPFENWDGVKVIKSHWFAYHLGFLHHMFPKAKIVSCYAEDIACFYWWHKCGGWGMQYPNYTWYENDTKMLEQIKQENSHILKFNKDKQTPIEFISNNDFYKKLGLSEIEGKHELELHCQVAVYSGGHIPDFQHVI